MAERKTSENNVGKVVEVKGVVVDAVFTGRAARDQQRAAHHRPGRGRLVRDST